MIEFGKTLKDAREAKGYTISQIADMTRMMSSIVEGLENEDFSRIAAPIYGRGFVKLYCEAVGLDPKPLVAEFMEIFNGNREPSIRERQTPAGQSGVTSEPETPPSSPEQSIPSAEERPCGEEVRNPANEPEVPAVPETPPEPVTAPEPPGGAAFDLFSQPIAEPVARHSEPAPAAEPPPEPAIQAMPPETEPSGWPVPGGDNGDRGPVISRYATPLRDYAYDLPRIAPAIGRWAIIAVALALVLWGAIAGVRALYRATANTSAGEEEPGTPAAAVAETPEPAKPAVQKAAGASDAKTPEAAKPRTIQDIPPLYID